MTLISHLGSLELRPKLWLHYELRLTAFTALLVLVVKLAKKYKVATCSCHEAEPGALESLTSLALSQQTVKRASLPNTACFPNTTASLGWVPCPVTVILPPQRGQQWSRMVLCRSCHMLEKTFAESLALPIRGKRWWSLYQQHGENQPQTTSSLRVSFLSICFFILGHFSQSASKHHIAFHYPIQI